MEYRQYVQTQICHFAHLTDITDVEIAINPLKRQSQQ